MNVRSVAHTPSLIVGWWSLALSTPASALDVPIRVPEPDTITLIAVAVAAGVLIWRNRRK
ncbi:MAG: PEP-CTERM sorting domain-containing protein [Burkholderiales bacterium]